MLIHNGIERAKAINIELRKTRNAPDITHNQRNRGFLYYSLENPTTKTRPKIETSIRNTQNNQMYL